MKGVKNKEKGGESNEKRIQEDVRGLHYDVYR